MKKQEEYYLELTEGKNLTVDDGKAFIIIVLFALSAFFFGSETALLSLSRIQLKRLENSDKTAQKGY
jgi:CBS domain containing-hemolysin-like protein